MPTLPAAARRLLPLFALIPALASAVLPTPRAAAQAAASAVGSQLERGAELYAWNCAVCHGAGGLGLAEAKQSFPPDHRNCTRCHKRGNPAQMSFDEMNERQHDVFDLGEPPPLQGEGALAVFPDAGALFTYVRATMPRYQPGRLSDQEYLDLTAYLLNLDGRLPGGTVITAENAGSISLD